MRAVAKKGTKIFGMMIPVDPKILLVGLVVLFGIAVWWNTRSSDDVPTAAPGGNAATSNPAPTETAGAKTKGRGTRRNAATIDRGVLRIKTVDATDGRIDPTLRVDLLARLQTVQPVSGGRSLFEVGPSTPTVIATAQPPIKGPKIFPNQPGGTPTMPSGTVRASAPVLNIPLRYYGFVNPASKREASRGLFMDGDNILVAKEGEQLEGRYLVVSLNANNARMEDTQMRQGQILPVTPEAAEQQ